MNTIENYISSQIDINNKAIQSIIGKFEPCELRKGDYLLKSDTICKKIAFIETGYLRMFNIVDGNEITLWIGGSGRFITSVSSFVFQTKNLWNIQAITDCKLLVINREKHFELCQKEPKWLEFDNLILANAFAILEQRMFSHLHTTASERLQLLLNEEPELFLNVPHQYIASMLGIAPESLSRLRKKLVKTIS